MNELVKYRIGDTVYIRDHLEVGEMVYNRNGYFEPYREEYSQLKGQVAKIIGMKQDEYYILDLFPHGRFTEGMLEHVSDRESRQALLARYDAEETAEDLPTVIDQALADVQKEAFQAAIDKGLDERQFESDPDTFQQLVADYQAFLESSKTPYNR